MSDWSSGYVTDLEYGDGYYASQSPALLQLTCLLFGLETSAGDDGFTYCELGCGTGLTSLILAATNPSGRFVAVDFNPAHVLQGRKTAAAAGLDNIEFRECGFDELADGKAGSLPELDFITLHGVYSWVSKPVRDAILRIVDGHLKPGGIAYVSHNTLPGWADCIPVQRLLHEIALLGRERSDLKVQRAIDVMEKLSESGADALKDNVHVRQILDLARKSQQRYLAHEYLNEFWNPMFQADVAREFETAKLNFVGSTDLLSNYPQFMLTPQQREILTKFDDPKIREMLTDFCVDRRFREDVYVRGRHPMSAAKQNRLLGRTRLTLTVPRSKFDLKLKTHAGIGELSEETYGTIADALAERPREAGELIELVRARTDRTPALGEVVATLVGSRQAFPLRPGGSSADHAAARDLNRVLLGGLESLESNKSINLAASLLGSGVRCGFAEVLIYDAMMAGVDDVVDHAARKGLSLLKAQGDQVMKDDKPIEDDGEALAELRRIVRSITELVVPVWQKFHFPPLRSA